MDAVTEGQLDITLDAPHQIELEVVNPDGTPHLGEIQITAFYSSCEFRLGEPLGGNRYRVTALPSGEVEINASSEEWNTSIVHDTRQPSGRIVYGELGAIVAKAAISPQLQNEKWKLGIALPGSLTDCYRANLRFFASDPTTAEGGIAGIAAGTYEAWLEVWSGESECDTRRVGTPKHVLISSTDSRIDLVFAAEGAK